MTECALRVVAVAANKGGVGKTTLAVNLAVLVRALAPEERVLLLGLDDQNLIDRMFGDGAPASPNIADVLRRGGLDASIRTGRHGVLYVPSCGEIGRLKTELTDPRRLRKRLAQSAFSGLVIVDTKSDLEILTQNALWAADLTLVPVSDETSLSEAERLLRLLESLGRTTEHARLVLSLVDLRIKYRSGEYGDVLAWLLGQIRARGLPLFETFVSRSPRVEALHTNAQGRPLPVLEGAPDSIVCEQLRHLAADVLRTLPAASRAPEAAPERRAARRLPYRVPIVAFRRGEPRLVQLEACDLSEAGLGARGDVPLEPGELLHLALRGPGDEPTLVWARVARPGGFTFTEPTAQLGEILRGAQPLASGAGSAS